MSACCDSLPFIWATAHKLPTSKAYKTLMMFLSLQTLGLLIPCIVASGVSSKSQEDGSDEPSSQEPLSMCWVSYPSIIVEHHSKQKTLFVAWIQEYLNTHRPHLSCQSRVKRGAHADMLNTFAEPHCHNHHVRHTHSFDYWWTWMVMVQGDCPGCLCAEASFNYDWVCLFHTALGLD